MQSKSQEDYLENVETDDLILKSVWTCAEPRTATRKAQGVTLPDISSYSKPLSQKNRPLEEKRIPKQTWVPFMTNVTMGCYGGKDYL